MNDISRCRREVKRWLALVALTLAALLTGMVSAVTAPSPEAQEIANFLMIASVTAIICSLFGVKQSNDHCRSVQYGLSVFEAMKKDLEGTEIELTSARYDVTDAQSDLYFAKKNAETLQDELTSVRAELEVDSMRPRMSLLKLKNGSIGPRMYSRKLETGSARRMMHLFKLETGSRRQRMSLPLSSSSSVKPSSSFVVKKEKLNSLNAATKISVRHAAKPR